ncbi:MAG: hypothetical protein QM757_29035 [Paludibaculum sp.]
MEREGPEEENMVDLPQDQRQELEDSWRARLEVASIRYQAATAKYRRMLEEQNDEAPMGPESTDALVRALQAESEARIEYGRVLRTLTDLTMYDKLPDGHGAESSGG